MSQEEDHLTVHRSCPCVRQHRHLINHQSYQSPAHILVELVFAILSRIFLEQHRAHDAADVNDIVPGDNCTTGRGGGGPL